MGNFKKIFWIIGLIILFFIGDRIGSSLLLELVKKSNFRYSRLYTGRARAEILLLGNSRGLIFYQPYLRDLTGKSNFNLSYNGLPIGLAKVLVADYYDQYDAPETLLIDVTMCTKEVDDLSAGFSCYSPFSARLSSYLYDQDPVNMYGSELTKLYKFNSEVFQRAMYYLNRSDESWLTDRVINDNLIQNATIVPPLSFNAESLENIQVLNQIVQLATSNGTAVKLVVNPYFPGVANRASGMKEWIRAIEDVTGIEVHDYSSTIKAPNQFADYLHPNKRGSIEYLNMLLKDGVL